MGEEEGGPGAGSEANGRKRIAAFAAAAFLLLGSSLFASAARADIIGPQNPDDPQPDSPWQAGTCTVDIPKRSIATPGQFYEEAAGHPPVGFTQFIVNTEPGTLGPVPIGNVRTVRVDIPPGLTVNPQATPQCELAPGESPALCSTRQPDSKVGTSTVRATNPLTGFSQTLPTADVFNIVPQPGEPARFGFSVLGNDVFLETDIEWEGDYHEYFTIHATKLELGIPGLEVARIAENRLVFDGTSGVGSGTFITTPTTCFGPAIPGTLFEHVYSTWLRADAYEEPNFDPNFPNGSAFVESKIPRKPGSFETSPKNCDSIPFDPSISVDPNTTQTDSPAGATVAVNLPEIKNPTKDPSNKASSQVRSAQVTLPPGDGPQPVGRQRPPGVHGCPVRQGYEESHRLPGRLADRHGRSRHATPPRRVAERARLRRQAAQPRSHLGRGVQDLRRRRVEQVRHLGPAHRQDQSRSTDRAADHDLRRRATGQSPDSRPAASALQELPDKTERGAKAALTSPGILRPEHDHDRDDALERNPAVTRSGNFSLSTAPGGGSCPKTLADRPFAPGFDADTNKHGAGDFSPLRMNITRTDGNQELKGVDVTLPPGLTAKLAGVRYCPGSALAAAAANSGSAEAADASCPDSSLIGHADVTAGSGPSPIQISGKVFLAGRYKGAPLSLAVITPATAGPFDLGTVVVRVALFVDPRTAQVHAVSDPIPHVYGGATLDIRSVAVKLDRKNFSLNPTNCSQFSFAGSLLGGGANPTDPAAFHPTAVSAPFQANGCEKLGFKPRLFLRLFGAMRRAKNPKLRAVLLPNAGDANIARGGDDPAALADPRPGQPVQGLHPRAVRRRRLPEELGLRPRDRLQPAARRSARAGPLYLRSSDNPLPDLVADLRGQVNVELASRTDSTRGRIRSTFDLVPDVPVSKFVLVLNGGPKGLLVNSRNQCPRKHAHGKGKRASASKARHRRKGPRAIVRFKAQNDKKLNMRLRLRTACGKHKGKRRK